MRVTRHFKQISPLREYEGYVIFDELRVDYRLVITGKPQDENSIPEIRESFVITITVDDKEISLSDQEYMFFFQMLVTFIFEKLPLPDRETDYTQSDMVDFEPWAENFLSLLLELAKTPVLN